jgi:hypothetical protein
VEVVTKAAEGFGLGGRVEGAGMPDRAPEVLKIPAKLPGPILQETAS